MKDKRFPILVVTAAIDEICRKQAGRLVLTQDQEERSVINRRLPKLLTLKSLLLDPDIEEQALLLSEAILAEDTGDAAVDPGDTALPAGT